MEAGGIFELRVRLYWFQAFCTSSLKQFRDLERVHIRQCLALRVDLRNSDIPGPFAASFTRLWHMNHILKGDQNLELIRLHEKLGT
ncbi:unnamed protein product [Fusarium graminearum]|uniref:Uncharacterized protein n=1 Tax=Gibberella zeae TaxID=5518 RepID=A0A4E9EIE6_GIBZA|nr:unnamed protein product [Fusarium graminearum]